MYAPVSRDIWVASAGPVEDVWGVVGRIFGQVIADLFALEIRPGKNIREAPSRRENSGRFLGIIHLNEKHRGMHSMILFMRNSKSTHAVARYY